MLPTIIGFSVVFALLFLGAPIAFGMALVGFTGFAWFTNWHAALAMLGQISYQTTISDELSVLPLFILMGSFINHAGLGQELYDCANAFLGHRRGGLAMATIAACGGFAAVSGSSMATAATMSKVAMPAMRRYGYADSLAAGSIAAGGTLGILIPPSVIMVLYGIMTSTDIGKLFIAGIVPGIIGAALYILAISTVTWLNPKLGPPGERSTWRQRLHALSKIWGVLMLFLIVMGGIYLGLFTPTEAAGIGSGGAFLFALARHKLTWRILFNVLVETARTSAMMFVLLIGAIIFSNFINIAGLPSQLSAWLELVRRGADHRHPVHSGDLRGARLPARKPEHDPADHPDLLSDRQSARLRSGLVRRDHRGGGRDRDDHATDRAQCLRAQGDAEGCPGYPDFPRGELLHRGGYRTAGAVRVRAPGRFVPPGADVSARSGCRQGAGTTGAAPCPNAII